MIRILLPWPSNQSGQNVRMHHFQRASATKKARTAAAWFARSAKHTEGTLPAGDMFGVLILHPPRAYRYDTLNIGDRMKAPIDGVADALGFDDHKIRGWAILWKDKTPDGMVELVLLEENREKVLAFLEATL